MSAISVLDHHWVDQKDNGGDVLLPLEYKDSKHDQNISSVINLTIVDEKQAKRLITEHDRDMKNIKSQLIKMPLLELSDKIANFENITCKKWGNTLFGIISIECFTLTIAPFLGQLYYTPALFLHRYKKKLFQSKH